MKRITYYLMKGSESDGYYLKPGVSCEEARERIGIIEDILGDEYDLDRLRVIMDQRITLRDEVAERWKLTGDIPLDRLAELVRAEKDGRCVVLPCKVGNVVYSAFPLCGVNSHQIRKFEIDADGGFACSALMIPFSDFGKTVFLTREEAEKALKERENNE